jgi:CheY-like chemotaxis protein
MKPTGKILIVDDDPSFLKLYQDRLGEEGYAVEAARDRAAALQKLAANAWDVVLLDQKLEGPGGPDSGFDLLAEITRRSPGAKTILVTAHATTTAIHRAFREGVYDYLQKDNLFTALLVAKLRNLMELVRAQRLGELTDAEAESAIRDTWDAVQLEADPNRKGKLLEDLMALLLKTIRGFHQTSSNRRNETEEIDVLVRNESTDAFWVNERTSYILLECKNWSKPVGVAELRSFIHKVERKFDRCRLGLLVAPGGFTESLRAELRAERKNDKLVVLLGREDLAGLVASRDRSETLKELHERAVIDLNGH